MRRKKRNAGKSEKSEKSEKSNNLSRLLRRVFLIERAKPKQAHKKPSERLPDIPSSQLTDGKKRPVTARQPKTYHAFRPRALTLEQLPQQRMAAKLPNRALPTLESMSVEKIKVLNEKISSTKSQINMFRRQMYQLEYRLADPEWRAKPRTTKMISDRDGNQREVTVTNEEFYHYWPEVLGRFQNDIDKCQESIQSCQDSIKAEERLLTYYFEARAKQRQQQEQIERKLIKQKSKMKVRANRKSKAEC